MVDTNLTNTTPFYFFNRLKNDIIFEKSNTISTQNKEKIKITARFFTKNIRLILALEVILVISICSDFLQCVTECFEENKHYLLDAQEENALMSKILQFFFFRRRKIEICKSSETRVTEVSRRS